MEVQLTQQRPCRLALISGQSLLVKPAAALDAEQVCGGAARHEVAMQDRLDLVLQPGALAHEMRAASDLAAARLRVLVSDPHPGQVVGGQQLREDLRVDLVGLDLRLGDRPGLLRVAHHNAGDMALQQPHDRVRIASRLQRDLVGRRETAGEQPQRLRCRVDPSGLADQPVLPDRDLREIAMHIQSDAPSAHCAHLVSRGRWVKQKAGKTTPTDPRSKRIRASRRGGHLLTRPRRPSNKNGLPVHVCSWMPPSRTVAPYSPPRTFLQRPGAVPRHGRHPPPFIPDTNTIEALNRQIRKIIKTRGSFPNEDSARKLLYLAITRAQTKWRHVYNWSSALAAFRIHFGDRLPDNAI